MAERSGPVVPMVLLSCLVALAACAGGPAASPTTSAPPTTRSSPTSPTPATSPGTSPPTTESTTPAPMAFPAEAPTVLMATERGVLVDARPLALSGTATHTALPDREGGVVAQVPIGQEGQADVLWIPSGEGEPRALLPSGSFSGAIHQVRGDRLVVLTRRVPEEEAVYLELLHLDGGPARRLAEVGHPTTFATRVSHAAGLYVLTEESEACGRLYALDESGREADAPWLPTPPPCPSPHQTPFAGATLSPDGGRLAYVAQFFRSPADPAVARSELVVVDTRAGEELVRQVVTDGPGARIVSLDFDGDWVVMARAPAETPAADTVVGRSVSGASFLARVPGLHSVRLSGP